MEYKVAITDTNVEGIDGAVRKAIALAGGFCPEDNTVIAIKPNLTSDKCHSESGVTTNVEVVEAVIRHINACAKGCDILIVESDSDGTAAMAFKRLGYEGLAARYGNVKLVDLSRDKFVKLLTQDDAKVRSFDIPETLLSINYFISIANLKRHVHECFSGIWKNSWGLPSHRLVRLRFHPFLPEALFDLNRLFWPDLSIIDGVVGLDGAGPLEGFPRKIGKIICSKDPLAADIVGARLIGEDPKKVPALRYAVKRMPREDIVVVGEELKASVKFKSYITKPSFMLYRLGLLSRRWGVYMENLGGFFAVAGYALRIAAVNEFMGGGMQSLTGSLKTAKDFLWRIEVADKLHG